MLFKIPSFSLAFFLFARHICLVTPFVVRRGGNAIAPLLNLVRRDDSSVTSLLSSRRRDTTVRGGLKGQLCAYSKQAMKAQLTASATVADYSSTYSLAKRVMTGVSLGVICTLWILGNNHVFCGGFVFASLIAQSEYAAITLPTDSHKGVRAIQNIFTALCCITATYFPSLHQTVLPLYISVLMVWLLTRHRAVTLTDVSLPLLGVFFVGYLPSYWIRLVYESGFSSSVLCSISNKMPWRIISARALLIWWTWCSIVIADVGAFFGGRTFGNNKLASVAHAAGLASPNKTVEGALVGIAGCTLFSALGAFLMRWPHWQLSGALYGLLLGFFAMIGDLTVSTIKRNAGVKDSGKILPGHGGLLDRIDSYILNAPVAFVFVTSVLPVLARAP